MNQALPFMPPLEPEEIIEAVDATARKLLELDGTAFDAMWEAMTGWSSMARRQQFAFLANQIRRYDMQLQQQLAVLDAQLAMPVGVEVAGAQQVVAQQMLAAREELAAKMANPGMAFFSDLARIDARKTRELADFYSRALKVYGEVA